MIACVEAVDLVQGWAPWLFILAYLFAVRDRKCCK